MWNAVKAPAAPSRSTSPVTESMKVGSTPATLVQQKKFDDVVLELQIAPAAE